MKKFRRIFALALAVGSLIFAFEGVAEAQTSADPQLEPVQEVPRSCGRLLLILGAPLWPSGLGMGFGGAIMIAAMVEVGGSILLATGSAMFLAGLPMMIIGLVRRRRCRDQQACTTDTLAAGVLFQTSSMRFSLAPLVPEPL